MLCGLQVTLDAREKKHTPLLRSAFILFFSPPPPAVLLCRNTTDPVTVILVFLLGYFSPQALGLVVLLPVNVVSIRKKYTFQKVLIMPM